MTQDAEANLREVSGIALNLWKQAGRPPGRYVEFWMRAERLVAAHLARSNSLRLLSRTEEDAPARTPDQEPRWSVASSNGFGLRKPRPSNRG